MRRPRTHDDLDATHGQGQTPGQSRTMARQLEAWAAEGTGPGDEVNAAELLAFASKQLLRVRDAREAVRVLRAAVTTGEPVEPDVRAISTAPCWQPVTATAPRARRAGPAGAAGRRRRLPADR